MAVFRKFVRENPVLTEVMFARPFTDFDPRPEDVSASGSLRDFIVSHVQRCIDGGRLRGDAVDISHVLLALAQGLAAQETAGWLGARPSRETAAGRSRSKRYSTACADSFVSLSPGRPRTDVLYAHLHVISPDDVQMCGEVRRGEAPSPSRRSHDRHDVASMPA